MAKVKLYSFEDLDEEVQDKVLDMYRDINVYDGMFDHIIDEFKTNMKRRGVIVDNVYYDLERGACFDSLNVDIKKLACNTKWYLDLTDEQRDNFSNVYIRCNERHKTQRFCFTNYFVNDLLRGSIEFHVDAMIDDLVYQFYKRLRDEYEYQTSDWAVRDMIDAHEFQFTKSGVHISEIDLED